MNIFSIDSPLYKIGSEIADLLILLVYWFLCCIPVVTIGASTTAFFYVAGKKVRGQDVSITKDFFKSFKLNFKQSLPITIFFLIAWCSGFLYYQMGKQIIEAGNPQGIEKFIPLTALIYNFETIVMTVYVFAVLSRFHMKTKNLFITAFVLAHRHFMTTLAILGIIWLSYFLAIFAPAFIFIIPLIVVFGASFLLQKIFNKYIERDSEKKKKEVSEIIDGKTVDENVQSPGI